MNWTELIGGLGIGSFITSITTNYLAHRSATNDRWFQEKRDSYIGLLNALHDAAVHPSEEKSQAYALWQTKCNIFGSSEVSKYAQNMVDTNDGPPGERNKAFEALINAMRSDLKP
jgi:hypothetical protein